MAYNQLANCSTADVITGVSPNCDVQIGSIEKVIFAKETQEFATQTLAETEPSWGTAIAAKTLFPLPLIEEFEDNSEDDVYYTSPITSLETFIREGKANFTFKYKFDPCLHKRLRGFNGQRLRMYMIDASNNILGTSPDNTVFKGFVSGTLRVQKWTPSTGDSLSFTVVKFVIESGVEYNDQIAAISVDWNVKGLNGVQPASLAVVGTPTATTIIVDVAEACSGVPIEGITELTDFTVLEADLTTREDVTVIAESATIPGRYTLTGVAFESLGTVNLINGSAVVTLVDQYYQGTAVTITFA
jgi:hypothetical protein